MSVELFRARSVLAPGAASLAQDVRRTVLHGEPLRDLLGAVRSARAQLLIIGAKGTGVVRHLLLGSVAEGALNHCPVGVLVAR